MKKFFEILPHKADLKIKVFGSSKRELFLNAMRAMFEAAGIKSEGKVAKRKIKIQSPDILQLLVDFLSEILYLSETENEAYFNIKFKKFSDNTLEGELFGKKIKKKELIIKGVTYHDLEIKEKKGDYVAIILFDV